MMIIIRKDGLKTFRQALSKSFFTARKLEQPLKVLRSSNGGASSLVQAWNVSP